AGGGGLLAGGLSGCSRIQARTTAFANYVRLGPPGPLWVVPSSDTVHARYGLQLHSSSLRGRFPPNAGETHFRTPPAARQGGTHPACRSAVRRRPWDITGSTGRWSWIATRLCTLTGTSAQSGDLGRAPRYPFMALNHHESEPSRRARSVAPAGDVDGSHTPRSLARPAWSPIQRCS